MRDDKLQEIIELLPYSIRYSGEIEELLDYAKEQVERVQELENQLEHVQESSDYCNSMLVKREQLNKHYLGALKFYADEKNYEYIGIPTGNNPPVLPISEDRGQVARRELESDEC